MKNLLILPGDGIGPEVTNAVKEVATWLKASTGLSLTIDEALFGGASIDAHGIPLTDAVIAQALASDAVLLGAVGGPKWAGVAREHRPEAGLLKLREAMGAFANLRPVTCFPALTEASTLKAHIISGVDIMIVRELTGGIYFGRPKFIETLPGDVRRAVDTQVYTSIEIERVAHVAFALARSRQGRLCSAEKSNVMETGLLWRHVVTELGASHYPDVELTHMLADNVAMQLVANPRQFDVLLTDNLFGDILSDEAGMLSGSIGMLPSAALGADGSAGLYEPIHGSAPDIAGQNIANPLACLLSFAMALRLSLGAPRLADHLETGIGQALEAGYRTRDLGGTLGTTEMTLAIVSLLEQTRHRSLA